MIFSVFYFFLAILALSFLIFIHELGHYWMARRVGMRVETFAIGFGKPLYVWERDGVKWQIGWIPFGGFVKIAGTETDSKEDLYQVSDGFFGKSPWDRIKVAFMGPLVNLLFAFVVFAMLWAGGGRVKNFAEFSSRIGWVDPKSELFSLGVRPGDQITAYDSTTFTGYKDHIYGPMTAGSKVTVAGLKINDATGERIPFEYNVRTYPHPALHDKSILSAGIVSAAGYVIYDRLPDGTENPLMEGSPLRNSGIQYGDRILWVDGESVFSNNQMSELINDERVLTTIQRGGKVLLRRVPRVRAQELRPDAEFREEMIDWMHAAGLQNRRFQDLWAIPYNLTHDCIVENTLRFIDPENQSEAFPQHLFSEDEEALQPGDRIIAVQGSPVSQSYELLKEIQYKQVNIIVERNPETLKELPYQEANRVFNEGINWGNVEKLSQSIGTGNRIHQIGNLVLLRPVMPKALEDFPLSEEAKAWLAADRLEKQKDIEAVEDSEKRAYLTQNLINKDKKLVLGLPNVQDKRVVYNPKPTELFQQVADEIGRTLGALFSGTLSPKYIAGPVGIVSMVQSSSQVSLKEALFWVGAISLNLGMLNLIPIPILDGGTIVLSFFEMVTGRRIPPKTLEKVIMFFAILLIAFFLFLTYNDVLRLFESFFRIT